jgi:hypothetical protein
MRNASRERTEQGGATVEKAHRFEWPLTRGKAHRPKGKGRRTVTNAREGRNRGNVPSGIGRRTVTNRRKGKRCIRRGTEGTYQPWRKGRRTVENDGKG